MSENSPGPQREGEEEGERAPKRRKGPNHKPGDADQKRGKMGRKPNQPGLPRRAPGFEVPIVPKLATTPDERPTSADNLNESDNRQGMSFSPGYDVVTTRPLPMGSSVSSSTENDNYQTVLSPVPALASSLPFDSPAPLGDATQPFPEATATIATVPTHVPPPVSRAHNNRGQQPITPGNLNPAERFLRIKILSPYGEVEFNNAIASPRWKISVMDPKLAKSLGLDLQELPEEEIKRVFTPWGCLRLTRIVHFAFKIQGLEDEWNNVRVHVLNDNDAVIGVPLIVGCPWLERYAETAKHEYVHRTTTNVYENTTVYPSAEPANNVE